MSLIILNLTRNSYLYSLYIIASFLYICKLTIVYNCNITKLVIICKLTIVYNCNTTKVLYNIYNLLNIFLYTVKCSHHMDALNYLLRLFYDVNHLLNHRHIDILLFSSYGRT